jgi:ABC-type sugar transport system ATPase subunit
MLAKLAPELGIAHVLSRRPGEISGGERQRAAILKVLASGAPIWLLDEPLSNLDVWNKYHLRSIIGEVQKKEEATVLWVTHDSSDALMVANDSLVLYNGSLAQSGPPHKIAETPKSIDVARALRNPPSNEIPGVLLLDPSGTAQIRLGESPETIASITACITQIPQSSLETKVIALIDPKCVKISPVNAQLPLHISVKGQLCLTAHFREAPIFEFTTSLGRLRAYSDPDVADKISSQGFAFLSLPFSSLEVFEAETGKILNTVANLCSGPTQS